MRPVLPAKHRRVSVNSETMTTIEELAISVGAIVECPVCHESNFHAGDDYAERMTYARATQALKDEDRGLRGLQREKVTGFVKSVLDHASFKCPRCEIH